MKASIGIVALLLIFVLTLTPDVGTIRVQETGSHSSVEGDDSTGFSFGVNYLSAYNHYEPRYLSDQVLERDFALFREEGFKYVTLVAVWNYCEPELGIYDNAAFDDIRRVCEFAADYSLQVIIDFHTLMFNDSGKIPDWVVPRKFETVFTNETVHEAWLNFLNHTASYLNDVENIYSWHMMNEPANGTWACAVPTDAFIDLWTEMRAVFKSYSDRPVSIRFAADILDDPMHFNRDPRIYDLCDYVALNWYEDQGLPEQNLTNLIKDIQQHGKSVMISEFGSNETGEDVQASKFAEYIQVFKNAGVHDIIAWMWRADNSSTSNPEGPGQGYDLAKDWDGTPRKAFYLLRGDVLALVVRGIDNGIYYRTYNSSTDSWNSWVGLPGATCDSPAAAVYQNELHIVVRGMDGNTLWQGYVDLSTNVFSGWSFLSGATPSASSLASNGTVLCLVVRGLDDCIYFRCYDGSWDAWHAIPTGTTCDSPSSAMLGNNLSIVVRGMDGTSLWYIVVNCDGSVVRGWMWISGVTASKPVLAASQDSNELYLAVRGLDNSIYCREYVDSTDSWSAWNALPGATCDGPAATMIVNELQVVVRGMDGNTLWHWNGSTWTWISGATPSAPTLAG